MSESKKNMYKSHDINTLEYIRKLVNRIVEDKDFKIIPLNGVYFFTLANQDSNNIRMHIMLLNMNMSKYDLIIDEHIKEHFEKITIAHAEELQSHLDNLINELKENTNG